MAFRVNAAGEGTLRVQAGHLALANAQRTDHMVKLQVAMGDFGAEQTRLWKSTGRRLETAR